MTYDNEHNSVTILTSSKNTLKSYSLDLSTKQIELVSTANIGAGISSFDTASSTLHFAILESMESYQVVDVSTLKVVKTFPRLGVTIQTSTLDDIILVKSAIKVYLEDLNTLNQKEVEKVSACSVMRH